MPVDYSNFVSEAAELLAAASPVEIKFRCSMSRSYYGVYHHALSYADTISVPPVSATAGATHQKLSAFYQSNLHADMQVRRDHRRVGYVLKQLHENRVRADYKLELSIERLEAQAHFERCQALIGSISALMAAKAA